MKHILSTVTILTLLFGWTGNAEAQDTVRHRLSSRIDSMLTERYYRTPFDTNYVKRPEGKLTLRLRLNQTGNSINVKGTIDGLRSKGDLSTKNKTTISIGASYRGLSAAIALNPGKLSGSYKDFELNLNYYSRRFSVDASYQKSSTLSGDIKHGTNVDKLESGSIDMKMVNISGTYTFNHRRFSFPAAMTQSYIQKKSAGSWLVGVSFLGCSMKTNKKLIEKDPSTPNYKIRFDNYGIGGGYAFNWVPGKHWLIHLSVMPTVVVYNHNTMSINGERIKGNSIRLNLLFNEHLSVVYNFGPRYFAGLSLIMNNSIVEDKDLTVNQSKWRARATMGVRLF